MEYYKKMIGKNICLASINLNDAEKYMELVNDNSHDGRIVFEGYKSEKINSIEEARDKLNDMAIKNYFAIIDKSNNKLIGFTGLSNVQSMNQRSSIWIKIDPSISFDKQVHFGAEAIDLLLEYAFEIMNLNSIVMDVPAFNKQGLEIAKTANMFFMCERHEASCYDDKYYNLESFQCTRSMYGTKKGVSLLDIDESYVEYPKSTFDNSSSSLHRDGSSITLTKYDTSKVDYVSKMAHFLNNPLVSIPLGEYKINWNDYRALKQLQDVSYIIEKYDDLIGYINLFRKDSFNNSADLEIVIGDRNEQNKGYGREALSLFLEELYNNSSYNSLVSSIFDFNAVSTKLHESMGYEKIGTRKEAYFAYGRLNDMNIYEMNKTLYKKKKSSG